MIKCILWHCHDPFCPVNDGLRGKGISIFDYGLKSVLLIGQNRLFSLLDPIDIFIDFR